MENLFALEHGVLFAEAQKLADGRRKIFCSPNIITTRCKTRPICRHCKWENIKSLEGNFQRRRTREEIVARAKMLLDAGVNRIFMASGWMGYNLPTYFYEYISLAKEYSGLELYGLFGSIDRESLRKLREAGMDGYLCGLESPDEEIYRSFRPGGDSLQDRINTLRWAGEMGLKLWSGFLVGLGEADDNIATGLRLLKDLDVDSVSILPFIPVPHTAMWHENPANPLGWARAMAIARIYLEKPEIFSDQTEGLYAEYGALGGANGYYIFP